MKKTLIAVFFTSFIILTGCNSGCGGSSWGSSSSYSSASYTSAGCGAATCCGSGSW